MTSPGAVILCLTMICQVSSRKEDKIGAIFDKNSEEIREAFKSQINFLNNNEDKSNIHLVAEIRELDATDSFAVSNAICYLLNKGVYGIIGVSNASALSTIQSYSNTFQVPFLALSMAQNSSYHSPFQLFMRPMYVKGILDVITNYRWTHLLYVYDTDEEVPEYAKMQFHRMALLDVLGLIRLQQLFQAVNIGEITLDIDVKRVTDVHEAYMMLKDLHQKDEKANLQVFLDLATKKAEEIIVRIKNDTEVQNHKFHFLLGELGMEEMSLEQFRNGGGMEEMSLEQFKNGGVNITGFQLVNQTSGIVERFLNKWSKYDRPRSSNKDIIKFESALVIDAVDLFYRALKILKNRYQGYNINRDYNFQPPVKCTDSNYVSSHNGTIMMGILKDLEFNGITGKVCFDDRGYRKKFRLQLMDITITMGLATVGKWSREDGLKMEEARRRPHMGNGPPNVNKTRTVTTILEKPYMMYKDEETEKLQPKCGKHNFIGFCADLAEKVARQVGFDYDLCLVPDGKYGAQLDNGTWNGMIGQLVKQEKPYMMYKDEETERLAPRCGKQHFIGFCAELAERVAKIVNFTYDICLVKDGKYGEKLDNGTWNGMVGELTREEVDLAIAPMSISSQREIVVDFTKPYMSLGISIMIMKTPLKTASVWSFMDPLSYEIWMCILFAYIGVSVVLFLVSRFSPSEWHVDEGATITNDFTISNSLWYSLGAFMQQGCDISPRSVSGRIVGSVWWFFTLIIISSYTANLAAFLTVERMLTPIESAEDLAKQTEIQYGTLDAGSTKNFFKQSKVAVYQRMWAYMQSASPSVFVQSNAEGIDRVREGNYAFLIESTTNDYINMRDPCDTMKVGTNLDSKGYGIATPVGSDLRDKLTLAVLKLRESGDLEDMQKQWWEKMSECPLQDSAGDGGQTELNLWNVAGIFYILVAGLILSVVIACFEFIYKSKIDSRRSKTSFGSVLRCKARLSFRGSLDKDNPGSSTPLRKSMSTYTYTGPTPMVASDGYTDNTHTQV